MNYELFLEKVDHRTPPKSVEPERLTRATLRVLGARMGDTHRRAVAAQLPDELAGELRDAKPAQSFEIEDFYRAIAEALDTDMVHAMEGAQIVCEVITEAVDDEGLTHLKRDLEGPMAELFQPRNLANGDQPTRNRRTIAGGATIGTGMPGSKDSLASGRPGSKNSIAGSDGAQGDAVHRNNPHEGRKLSSGKPDYD